MHIDIMDKCRRKGHPVPQRLDPLRRTRGRAMVKARKDIDKTDVDALQKLVRKNSKMHEFCNQVAMFKKRGIQEH